MTDLTKIIADLEAAEEGSRECILWPKAKLTEQQVAWIRHDPRPTRYVAHDYRVSKTTIQRIRSGKSWTAALRAKKAEEQSDG